VTSVYEFIDAQYATSPAAPAISRMCAWLEVSKSGFYEWRSRPESATVKRRNELKLLIQKAFDDSDGTYGYRRVWSQLARWGVPAGLELVRALMRELALVACQPRPWRPSTTQQGQAGPIPDLVNRDFSAEAPGTKIVGDITYIQTWEGWLYLATAIDCATRKVVGWAMDDNYKTPLITAAIEMAARNVDLPAAPSSIQIAAAITRRASSPRSWKGWGSASLWAAPGYATAIAWQNPSMPRSKSGASTGQPTRHGKRPRRILPATSNSGIIGDVFTQHWGTGLRKKSSTST
jgi:hypothetical protein